MRRGRRAAPSAASTRSLGGVEGSKIDPGEAGIWSFGLDHVLVAVFLGLPGLQLRGRREVAVAGPLFVTSDRRARSGPRPERTATVHLV